MSYRKITFRNPRVTGRWQTRYQSVATGQFVSEADVITYTFTWHSMGDACPKCLALNGREWSDQDLFQETLWDPIWGDIYSLDLAVSLAHGGPGNNCRCQLETRVHVDLEQMPEYVEFNDLMGAMI